MDNSKNEKNLIGLILRVLGFISIISGFLLYISYSENIYYSAYAKYMLIFGAGAGLTILAFAEIIVMLQKIYNRMYIAQSEINNISEKITDISNRNIEKDKENKLKELVTEYKQLLEQNKYDESLKVLEKINEMQSQSSEPQEDK